MVKVLSVQEIVGLPWDEMVKQIPIPPKDTSLDQSAQPTTPRAKSSTPLRQRAPIQVRSSVAIKPVTFDFQSLLS
jgi:hypothetical protein